MTFKSIRGQNTTIDATSMRPFHTLYNMLVTSLKHNSLQVCFLQEFQLGKVHMQKIISSETIFRIKVLNCCRKIRFITLSAEADHVSKDNFKHYRSDISAEINHIIQKCNFFINGFVSVAS